MQEEIVNRVAKSNLITFDLEELHEKGDRVELDISDQLYEGLILREKDFRLFVKEHDWNQYRGKYVAVHCSADAIVPTWAYMLIASRLSGLATFFIKGDLSDLENALFMNKLEKINPEDFKDTKVVIKGCSDLPVPDAAYVELVRLLTPFVSSIMFGEPCSTVPVYKARK
jgi:hypothetical protein